MKKLLLGLLIALSSTAIAQKTISFPANDGLTITADLYMANDEDAPFIILFHQARWSRGEYLEIAPKLNALGFNCIAIDQRSGGEVNGVINKTHKLATEKGLGTDYIDALVDLNSSIDYVKKTYTKADKLIIWGSSYSSALVIHVASTRDDFDGALSFAPGEYFSDAGKPKDWLQRGAKNVSMPIFITSAKLEKKNWWAIASEVPEQNLAYFLPTKLGKHGSRALWSKFADSEEYWKAVKEFLALFN